MAYGPPYGMASRNIATCLFLAAFLYFTFGETLPKSEVEPQFLAPLENHTVTQGRDVSFTCVVNHLQLYKVAWIKADSRAILAIHTHMVAHNPRLSVTHNGHNTWKLHVNKVQSDDSGAYMCQINTDPMKSQTGYMKVVIPPDIMDLDDSPDLLTTKENNDLRLRCRATGTPKPVVIWRREDGRNITLRNGNTVKRVQSYEGEQLYLSGILRQEMGSYLCIASNGVPPTISKRYRVSVQFKPLIKITNQLVAAPVDSDVVLQCYMESYPKALNTWYKDNGMKLLTDEKYNISEIVINDYSYQLHLAIRQLNRSDFGSYVCSAENPLGKVDGTIRLQELYLSKTTAIFTRPTEALDKQKWTKQNENKNRKYFYAMGRDTTESTERNSESWMYTTTPMSERNYSNSLPNVVNIKKSKVSSFPAPAPAPAPALAPAHSAPTQLNAQNGANTLRYLTVISCVNLMPISVILTIMLY